MNKLSNKIVAFILVLTVIFATPGTLPTVEAKSNIQAVSGFEQTNSTSSSVTLEWEKVAGVTGYQIQQKTDGEYETVKTIKKSGKTVYVQKKLKAGSTYTFRIRAYKKSEGKKTYSAWKKVKATTDTASKSKTSKSSNDSSNSSGSSTTVYTTKTGTKYHSRKNCKGLRNANQIFESTKGQAENKGLDKCKLCW